MPTLSALRAIPHFAPLFAFVHVLCWPILVWQINRFYSWTLREGITDALYSVNRWGFLTVVRLGDKRDPGAYTPLVRTFRPLTDANWASDMPACLETQTPEASRALILPRVRRPAQAAHAPALNTS
ncbi:MAG: hypothetical protein FP825_02045 [Hyphomonas sp.]|uniref:hypothetical protein n=1 Tax=Hyphomonas sp. TaxID=87 RepID=UPI0018351559|nr:hypothetical protein [Hyphomonas sp.]MBA3067246.1 hypothetical protein [Hyphomonas sp.]